jgi:hypothetical protein
VFSAVAGLLIWFATQISNDHIGGYWARVGLVAGAGLLMALSQLLGGWTKWGWPRLSIAVLATAFIPVAIASLWIILAGEPGSGWFHNHVMAWSRDIHVSALVTDFLYYIPVLAFGMGLVFGFSFDTTGPVLRDRDVIAERNRETAPVNDRAADEPVTAEREATAPSNDRTTDRETVR